MRTLLLVSILTAMLCAPATSSFADPASDGRAVSEAFQKAVAAGDLQAVMALYRDDASVIWPGQGEEAKGKAAIEALARSLLAAMKGATLVLKSQESIALGDGYIVNVGRWENTVPAGGGKRVTVEVRTSEVLAKTDGKWLYLVDHASVGMPPAKPASARRRPPRRS
jgi:uncharacterized protein (TIGR02246 family)